MPPKSAGGRGFSLEALQIARVADLQPAFTAWPTRQRSVLARKMHRFVALVLLARAAMAQDDEKGIIVCYACLSSALHRHQLACCGHPSH